MPYDFDLIWVHQEGRALWATVDHPPINLIDRALFRELRRLGAEVAGDESVTVVVLQSANPAFFLAHFDVKLILSFPAGGEASRPERLGIWHAMTETFRTMPKATICKLEGRVGGGGNELAAAFDMRFGVQDSTVINQMEVPLGLIPGGGGCQYLPRLIGRNRALEMILGAIDVDAVTAEHWGYLNRIFSSRAALDEHVDALARRIASFPPAAVAAAKAAVGFAEPDPTPGLLDEDYETARLRRTPDRQHAIPRFLELGGQTPDGESRVAEIIGQLQ